MLTAAGSTGMKKKGLAISANPLIFMEAATGFEPVNNGFAAGRT
jgi:hypothetical protein